MDQKQKIRRDVRLGPSECPDLETGARFFSALAFPSPTETAERDDATRAWVAAYLHEANRIDGSDEPFADPRLNDFLQYEAKWCRAKVRTARRRLRDRMVAARAARPWVRELLEQPHSAVPGMNKFSKRQIALYLSDGDVDRAGNFQKRVWFSCRPVLHLAIAADLILCETEAVDFLVDLGAVEQFEPIVELSQAFAPLIASHPRFGVAREDLLQLEWIK